MDDERRVQARYPRHQANVKAARSLARQVAREWGLDQLAHDLTLVVSELVTNAIVHGKTAQGREVLLTFDLTPFHLRVEVRDSGDGCPRRQGGGVNGDSETGRGLDVVEAITSRWGVAERVIGKTVWAELALNPEELQSYGEGVCL
ncbi:ATP-binding protein [Streptomyces sp. DSM 44915]|uniref:ATP-binding protein n=1 Tax=Streptomyces chisholmiae TaxID=3075540 RepID=A0ABU2JSJ8_9ACTN|nr:ATP-binding protein [Streptomyces sp. DSM 44915]MDT0267957.1 ATP-binding protein [Streptomyces sp. DSM 44915]